MKMDLIDSLISCEKEIQSAPRKAMATDARNDFTLRNDFTCVSSDGKTFKAFMKMNTKFP